MSKIPAIPATSDPIAEARSAMYREVDAALDENSDDPVALVLIKAERTARMALIDAQAVLRREANHLRDVAERTLDSQDANLAAYRPNGLGNLQSPGYDVACGRVCLAQEWVESAAAATVAYFKTKEAAAE